MSSKNTIISFLKIMAVFTVLFLVAMPFINSWENQVEKNKHDYFNPGIAAYQQGNYADAEEKLKQFLAIYPSSSATLYNLGLCTLAEGKKQEARSDFHQTMANSIADYGQKRGPVMCGSRPCGDLSKEMLAWMDQNPNWDASQTTSVPPFPSAP